MPDSLLSSALSQYFIEPAAWIVGVCSAIYAQRLKPFFLGIKAQSQPVTKFDKFIEHNFYILATDLLLNLCQNDHEDSVDSNHSNPSNWAIM